MNYNEMTATERVEFLMRTIGFNPELILKMENPSEPLKRLAILVKPSLILEMDNPSEKLKKYAIGWEPELKYRMEI